MKTLMAFICMALITGCATSKMLQTEEGRKFLINSPEVQAVIKLELGERVEAWCSLDPLIRFGVRMELTAQRTYIPVLSDEDSCIK